MIKLVSQNCVNAELPDRHHEVASETHASLLNHKIEVQKPNRNFRCQNRTQNQDAKTQHKNKVPKPNANSLAAKPDWNEIVPKT